MMDTFEKDLHLFRKDLEHTGARNVWHGYGLLTNPFPCREPTPDVCVNQEAVKDEFRRKLIACYNDKRGDSLHIVGDTGAGKTNILKYYEALVNRLRMDGNTPGLFPIYIFQPGDTFLEVHSQVADSMAQWFFADLFERVKADSRGFRDAAQELSVTPSLVTAVEHVAGSGLLVDVDFPQRLGIFQRWLCGGKQLSAAERKMIGVPFDLDSSSVAVKVLSDLARLLGRFGLCQQFIVLFDEFEEIVSERLSRSARTRYAQDVRHFLDSFAREALVVIASTPLGDVLSNVLPALQRRLGEPYPLQPIADAEEALEYARAYIAHGRREFEESHPEIREQVKRKGCLDDPYSPLTEQLIRETFGKLKENSPQVLPGVFLPQLHAEMNRQVSGYSQPVR
jgi:hypothetical protein